MEQNFKIGDKVQLNSGGPVMTVNVVDPDSYGRAQTDMVQCVWFDKNDVPVYREFVKATLAIVPN
ncbi:MAG: DUF2158 domain-containing protein [Acinetobacter sp.]|nr:DUF2158 domain-containing protein [Acinetobacter sp.]